MANAIQIKRRSSSGSTGAPSASVLKWGELAFNEADNTLYYGYGSGNDQALSVPSIGGSGAYSLRGGTNATGVWPIDINGNAATVTNGVTYTGTPTAGYIPKFNDSDTIENGYQISTNLGTQNSDVYIPRADAVKTYIDSVKQGLDIKDSVRVATVNSGELQATYDDTLYTWTSNSNGMLTIDGILLVSGDRFLVKNSPDNNGFGYGIYQIVSSGNPSTPWSATIASDSASDRISAGAFTFVSEGTVNGDTGWVLTDNDPINILSSQVWSQFSAAGQIYDGSGLYKSGNVISVGTADSSRIVINADNIDLATVSRTDNASAPVGIIFPKVITTDSYGRVTGVSSGVVQNASTTSKGIAQFNSNNFITNLGVVDLKNVVNTTGNQSVSGIKTFANETVFNSGLLSNNQARFDLGEGNATFQVDRGEGYGDVLRLDVENDSHVDTGYATTLKTSAPSEDITVLLPNAGGTLITDNDLINTNMIAGSGLVGGGSLYLSRTFNIGSGDGIIVNPDNVAVDATVIRTTGDQTICGPKTFGGADLDNYILNIESSANGSGIITFSEPTVKMYVIFDGLNNELKIKEFAGDDTHKFNVTTYTKLRASGTASAASHIPVFVSDPTQTSQTLYYKTPSELLGDLNSVSTSRTLTAGSGLQGGGDLSANRTFDIKTGYGIDIVSDAVAVDTTEVVVTTGIQIISGVKTFSNRPVYDSGITTLAVPTSSNNVEYFAVFDTDPSGTAQILKSVSKSDVLDDIGGASSGISMTAGSGLVGGGNLSESRTFDIGQGNGITVNADSIAVNAGSGLIADANGVHIGVNGGITLNNDSIAVDSTVVRTTGVQAITGAKNFSGNIISSGTLSLKMATTSSNASQFPVFISDPSSNAQSLLTRTPSQVKSDIGLSNVENTALSTWAGTSNITTLGTITTGTWGATTIAVNKGGTGQTSYTNGQLLIGNTTGNTLTKATLTEAYGINITNGNGSITIGVDTNEIVATTGTQNVSGVKTFFNQPVFNSGLSIPHANGSVKVYSNETNLNNSNIYFDTDDSALHVAYKETLSATTFTAGSGLSGGGTLGADRTFNVGQGAGITVSADAVAHADTSTLTGAQGSDGIASITLDGFGHVTAVTTATYVTSASLCSSIANCPIDGGTF